MNAIDKIKKISFKKIIKNLYVLFSFDVKKEIRNNRAKINDLEIENEKLRDDNLFLKIMNYYSYKDNNLYKLELNNLLNVGGFVNFPYKTIKDVESIFVDYDSELQLPFVLHKMKKLYFPQNWSLESVRKTYLNYIKVECLLGGDFSEKSPHQYESDYISVRQDDVLLDIGAAEALFSLENIDKIRKLYVFEAQASWIPALNATFYPYRDKVRVINKFVSDKNTTNETTLDSCVDMADRNGIFIKLDIEGFEKKVLKQAVEFLNTCQNVRIVCCAYHYHDDAVEIKSLLEKMNFKTEFSEGYMLFNLYDDPQPPFFRKGVIRAKK